MICSTTTPSAARSSNGPGVADTKITWCVRACHSSKLSGRLSSADGSRNPVLDQHLFPRPVAVVHPSDLGHRLVALVDEHDGIAGQVIEQRRRRLAGRATREVSGVVLDAVAVADLANHLQVEQRALPQALRFEQLALAFELSLPLRQLRLDRLDGPASALARRHEVGLGVDGNPVVPPQGAGGQRVEDDELVHLVAEQADTDGLFLVGRVHLDDVAPHPERPPSELDVVPLVLDLDQLPENLIAVDALSHLERQHHPVVGLRRPQAVDAGHAGDNHDVPTFEQGARGREAHAIDLVVDRRFLLDVGVAGGDVGLGLVVVVVADEVLDRVVGKEAAEFLIQLRGQGLVVHHDQRGPVRRRDDVRHREGLA